MNHEEAVKRVLMSQPKRFCEFLSCLFNSGMARVEYDYQNDRNFSYIRKNQAYHMYDVFVVFEDVLYFEKVISQHKDAYTVSVLTGQDVSFTDGYQARWRISQRKQFCQDVQREIPPIDFVMLDQTHADAVAKSASSETQEYYALATAFDDDLQTCCGVLDGGKLLCSLSVAKTTKGIPMAEINWIFTEPDYRRQGIATCLLQAATDMLIRQQFLVTYHCADENIASACTALKAGMVQEQSEIIFEKRG